jgi:hypothetical protein
MKIQRRPSAKPKLFWKTFTKYFVGIMIGGLLAFSIFVVKDFFFYHLLSYDGHVIKQTLSQIICDSKSWHETEVAIEKTLSKASVPKVKFLLYEALSLLWLRQRFEKIITSIILGSSVGALFIMAIQHIKPARIAISPP